jgi:hypothetical protein
MHSGPGVDQLELRKNVRDVMGKLIRRDLAQTLNPTPQSKDARV